VRLHWVVRATSGRCRLHICRLVAGWVRQQSRNNGNIGSAAQDGTGVITGAFPGNDSGVANSPTVVPPTGPFGLKNAQAVLGSLYPGMIPAGALCADYENSWGGFGVDGCADNVRSTLSTDNDDILNPYWSLTYGPCPYEDCVYETTNYLTDYPIGMLARTSSNKYFALAFVASINRNGISQDASEGVFNVGAIVNGDPNPIPGKGNNIIPWQPVPRPRVMSVTPTTPGVPRNVQIAWDNIRIVHDGSLRNTGTTRPATIPASGGVGVLNFLDGPGEDLCRYQVQTAPVSGGDPNQPPSSMTWVNSGAPIPCGAPSGPIITANLTVNPDTAIRVRTTLGRIPKTTVTTLAQARLGNSGDLGFEPTDCTANNCLNSPPVIVVGGGLVGQQIIGAVATKTSGGISITFSTTAELSVSGIDVLGKGDAVIGSVACKQCNTGVGDSYDMLLDKNALKGAKTLRLRLNGPGSLTDAIPIQ
jgi:hypothetical protein